MFLTSVDILTRYGIQRTALREWRLNRGFPAPITPKNAKLLWRLEDVEAWEQNNGLSAVGLTY